MPCVYILQSQLNGKRYIGSSREAGSFSRLKSHNAGKTRSTKSGRPWILVYEENLESYKEARHRENFLKSGQGRKWLKEKVGAVAEWPNAVVSKTTSRATGTEVRILAAPDLDK